MAPISRDFLAWLRKVVAEFSGAGAKSGGDQLRTLGTYVRASGRRKRAMDAETADEIDRAAHLLKRAFAGEHVPDTWLGTSVRQLFEREYRRTGLHVKVTRVDRLSGQVRIDLAVHKADEPVGDISAIVGGADNRLIVTRLLDESARGMEVGRFLNALFHHSEHICRALGVRSIELDARGEGAWTCYKEGCRFNPKAEKHNRRRLIEGIGVVLRRGRPSNGERGRLIKMRKHLEDLKRPMPPVEAIATIGDGPRIGRAVLATGISAVKDVGP